MKSPQRTKENGRVRVLDAAIALYAEGGAGNVTMRAIGDRLGVSNMMPYRHFASKEDLFVEMRRLVFDSFGQYLEACAERGRTPEGRFRYMAHGYIRYGQQAGEDYRFIFDLWPTAGYHAVLAIDGASVLSETRSWRVLIGSVSELLGKPQSHRDVVVRSHLVWQGLHGLVSLHLAKKLGFGLASMDLARPTVEALLSIANPDGADATPRKLPSLPPVLPLLSQAPSDQGQEPRTAAECATTERNDPSPATSS